MMLQPFRTEPGRTLALETGRIVVGDCLSRLREHLEAHLVDDLAQVVLNLAGKVERARLLEIERLTLVGDASLPLRLRLTCEGH